MEKMTITTRTKDAETRAENVEEGQFSVILYGALVATFKVKQVGKWDYIMELTTPNEDSPGMRTLYATDSEAMRATSGKKQKCLNCNPTGAEYMRGNCQTCGGTGWLY